MVDFSTPDKKGELLLYSYNDFEKHAEYWKQKDEDISTEIKYEGDFSIHIEEYSPIFEHHANSLDLSNLCKLYIRSSVFCNYMDKTNTKFVISIENNEGTYIWEGN